MTDRTAPIVATSPTPHRLASNRLGALSERYESGGRGPGTVSTGRGDPGGVSYGLYQLASRTGTVAAFLAGEGAPWASEFGAAAPGTPAFGATWQAIAAREPKRFAAAQHAFIARTHHAPVVAAVLARTGLDLTRRARVLRDVCWSCAVQHGAAARIIVGAIAAVDARLPRIHPGYDRCLVEAIYDARATYVRCLAERVEGAARATLLAIADRRYPAERTAALAMLPPSSQA